MTPADIPNLHAAYQAATGYVLRLDMYRERQWFDWAARGFTQPDLLIVIQHLKRGIRNQTRNSGSLRFSNLIGQPDRFEEDLAEARQVIRKPTPIDPNRAAALRATGRPSAPPSPDGKTAAQILEGYEKLKAALKRP